MTTTPIAGDREPVRVAEPLFSDSERAALAGFLAGYSGLTRDAYTLDLRQYMSWCGQHGLHLFGARRADIESFGRDMEAAGRARATIARRLSVTWNVSVRMIISSLLDHGLERCIGQQGGAGGEVAGAGSARAGGGVVAGMD
jgi:hypothetical protein